MKNTKRRKPARKKKFAAGKKNIVPASTPAGNFDVQEKYLDEEILEIEVQEEEPVEVGEDPRKYEMEELKRQGYGDGGLEFQYTDEDEDLVA